MRDWIYFVQIHAYIPIYIYTLDQVHFLKKALYIAALPERVIHIYTDINFELGMNKTTVCFKSNQSHLYKAIKSTFDEIEEIMLPNASLVLIHTQTHTHSHKHIYILSTIHKTYQQ